MAGIGAGGIAALGRIQEGVWKARALAVLAVSAYAFVMVRVVPDVTLLLAPTLPSPASVSLTISSNGGDGRGGNASAADRP